ncbi:MAG: helix-turn-helix transcriptional regulator [Planctomycetes bacterium]|nr:helix-turn-helix transcriptional regulator [Planctomycetota bacterium]
MNIEIVKLRIGRREFVLVPASEYDRLTKLAARDGVDAVEFANASIGRSLARKRRTAGVSQAKVAAKAGLRVETLSRIENGHGNPTVATVKKILRALGERVSG